MVTVDDIEATIEALPEVDEGTTFGNRCWHVRTKNFAWLRPFSKADIRRFGDDPVPAEPILAVRVEDLMDKEAVLAEGRPGFFTIPHFDGFAAVLIELGAADRRHVDEALVDAWLAMAPPALAATFLAERGRD